MKNLFPLKADFPGLSQGHAVDGVKGAVGEGLANDCIEVIAYPSMMNRRGVAFR